MNRYLRDLYRTNYYMGYIASRIVRAYQGQYILYFKEICQTLQFPLNPDSELVENRSLQPRSLDTFENVIVFMQRSISNFFDSIVERIDKLSDRVVYSLERYTVPEQPGNVISNIYGYFANTLLNKAKDIVALANRSVVNIFKPFVITDLQQRSFTWLDWALIPLGRAALTVNDWIFTVLSYLTFRLMNEQWLLVKSFFDGIIRQIFHVPV